MSDALPAVQIYTDGSCSPNPGPGGWAAVIINADEQHRTLTGSAEDTTNNRMELTAAFKALESLESPHEVTLYTDSRYLKDGITEWLPNWQRRGWSTITGESVRNLDLWQSLQRVMDHHRVNWKWVKGHAGDKWNNLVDELAGNARQRPVLPLDDENAVHIYLAITWRQKVAAGAWAGIMQYRNHHRVVGGVRREGTGNGLHIVSATESLKELKRNIPVNVYTTSGYLKDGAQTWLKQWRRRNWLTREGLEVSNRQEWQELAGLLQYISVSFYLIDKNAPPCHNVAAKELAQARLAVEFPA